MTACSPDAPQCGVCSVSLAPVWHRREGVAAGRRTYDAYARSFLSGDLVALFHQVAEALTVRVSGRMAFMRCLIGVSFVPIQIDRLATDRQT